MMYVTGTKDCDGYDVLLALVFVFSSSSYAVHKVGTM